MTRHEARRSVPVRSGHEGVSALRLLVGAGLAVSVFFGARWVWRSLESDEARIQRLILESMSAFNEGAVGDVMKGFADDWQDRSAGVDRTTLQRILLYLARQRHPPYEAQLIGDEVRLDGADDADDAASASFAVRLRETGKPIWDIRIDARLRRIDGEWRFSESMHATLAGRRPDR